MTDGENDGMAAILEHNPVTPEPKDVVVEQQPEPDEPLDLTEDDEAVDVEDGEEGGEEDPETPKRRSKPASQRIAELTAKLREAERKLQAVGEPAAEATELVKPNPEDFEYGEADPAYIDKLTDYKLEKRDRDRAEKDGERQQLQAMQDRIETGVAKAQAEAQDKYPDFDAKIAEAVEARAGEPLPPLLTIGIGVSPVGGDIIYRLATDEAASERLETLAKGGAKTARQMAMALGELEGEYLEDTSDADLDMSDDLDMARMMGRLRARASGKKAAAPVKANNITEAPEPPKHRIRGGAGRFEVGADTTDFAAFEKRANSAR